MGMIQTLITALFGNGRNGIKEVIEIVRPNAEALSQRSHDLNAATLSQMAAEFSARPNRGKFDRFMDGVNRLPRPVIVLSLLMVLVATPMYPILMAKTFAAWGLIPTGFWTVFAVIVAFYFGGRHDLKTKEFQKELAAMATTTPVVLENLQTIDRLDHDSVGAADVTGNAEIEMKVAPSALLQNEALSEWHKTK